jgi:hypothetical protein
MQKLIIRDKKPIEYRLYYNDDGTVITYSTENLEGKYIVIDKESFAKADHKVLVIDNKLVNLRNYVKQYKLIISETGTKCSYFDINIVVEDDNNYNYWDMGNE